MNAINSITSIPLPPQAPGVREPGAADGPQFKDFLMNSLRDVNAAQQQADQAVTSLATGGDVNPAEVLSAVQKADLAFRMMLQVRNKLVQAYEEVKNIRV